MSRDKVRAGLDALAGESAGNVAGGKEGAEKGKKAEGQQPKRLTRRESTEARQYLETIGPSQLGHMLTGASSTLTAKQKAFAYHVAQGATKAEAYRTAYKRDATKRTMACKPYELARDERIKREIEAYQLAAEAAKYRTAGDLRALVIQALVQQVIDPDCPPAVRTQAAKTLGNVTEVAAFTERKESVVHHSSDKLRGQILEQIASLMGNTAQVIEGETVSHDAASLLAELAAHDADGPSPVPQDADTPDDGTAK